LNSAEKSIVSAPNMPLALPTQSRRLSSPASLVFSTVNIAGAVRSSRQCTFSRAGRRFLSICCPHLTSRGRVHKRLTMRLMVRLLLMSDGMGFCKRYYAIPSPRAKFKKPRLPRNDLDLSWNLLPLPKPNCLQDEAVLFAGLYEFASKSSLIDRLDGVVQ